LGASADVRTPDIRWLKPLPLWTGIVAGPIAWAIDLTASFASVKWACAARNQGALQAIAGGALAVACGGAVLSWLALQQTDPRMPTDGGHPRARARFMAILGLAASALFGLQIVAGSLPSWVIDACQ
jgi:hypothetical protein